MPTRTGFFFTTFGWGSLCGDLFPFPGLSLLQPGVYVHPCKLSSLIFPTRLVCLKADGKETSDGCSCWQVSAQSVVKNRKVGLTLFKSVSVGTGAAAAVASAAATVVGTAATIVISSVIILRGIGGRASGSLVLQRCQVQDLLSSLLRLEDSLLSHTACHAVEVGPAKQVLKVCSWHKQNVHGLDVPRGELLERLRPPRC